jgi:hypothetical protein
MGKQLVRGILVTFIAALAGTPADAARSEAEKAAVITASDCVAREALTTFSRNNDSNWEGVPAWDANATPLQKGVLQELIKAVLHASSASPSGTANRVWPRFHNGVATFANSCRNEIDRMIKVHDQFHGSGKGREFFVGAYREDLPRAVYERIKNKITFNSPPHKQPPSGDGPMYVPAPSGPDQAPNEPRQGRCRGFLGEYEIGMMIEPEPEGEGAIPCRFTQGSLAAQKIHKVCTYGSQCEVTADVDNDGNIGEVKSIASAGAGWAGTCRGKIRFEGDDAWQAGVLYDSTKGNIPCSFSSSLASGSAILGRCSEGSTCEISAKFEFPLPQGGMFIGHVTSVKLLQPPVLPESHLPNNEEPNGPSTPLGLCSAAIANPLRHMLLDVFIAGGKRLGTRQMLDTHSEFKAGVERDYGSFLTVQDDATVAGVEHVTGKVVCKVTYEMDLQGLAARVLEEGANRRAEILIRQMTQHGRIVRRRLEYTVQRSSGGFIVWLGSGLLDRPAHVQRRARACLMAFGGLCALWAVK